LQDSVNRRRLALNRRRLVDDQPRVLEGSSAPEAGTLDRPVRRALCNHRTHAVRFADPTVGPFRGFAFCYFIDPGCSLESAERTSTQVTRRANRKKRLTVLYIVEHPNQEGDTCIDWTSQYCWTNGWNCLWRGHSVYRNRPLIPQSWDDGETSLGGSLWGFYLFVPISDTKVCFQRTLSCITRGPVHGRPCVICAWRS